MPMAPPRHCPKPGHPPFVGAGCPACTAARRAAVEAKRPSARARGYYSKWEAARRGFLSAHPTCACGKPATTVDHVVPHKGSPSLFWSRSNWSAVCASCHSRKTAGADGGFGHPIRSARP
ncbi:HNH endonuclease signature motif containing protein [Geminicoccus sp.]|uniref:HNH endonuclease n=1 Tax=Geminicoccus sp. TaxID=2024832 RepID=UPI0032C2392E